MNIELRNMKHQRISGPVAGFFFGCILMSSLAIAASMRSAGPEPVPHLGEEPVGLSLPDAASAADSTPGSASLVPMMAAVAADDFPMFAIDEPAAGGDAGKPADDLSFVAHATEASRQEVKSAREALTRLRDPKLREMAEVMAHHHDAANERLAQIASSKGWPLPDARSDIRTPPKGTATPDFDARWTDEMIMGHERALSLYRAQAQGGEDKDLRKYARETLPTIEQHLDWLRSLQK